MVLPFKDSKGGTCSYSILIGVTSAGTRQETQCVNRAKAFAPHQNFGPAISEAAEPRCATPSAIKLPDTPRWSEERPR